MNLFTSSTFYIVVTGKKKVIRLQKVIPEDEFSYFIW